MQLAESISAKTSNINGEKAYIAATHSLGDILPYANVIGKLLLCNSDFYTIRSF